MDPTRRRTDVAEAVRVSSESLPGRQPMNTSPAGGPPLLVERRLSRSRRMAGGELVVDAWNIVDPWGVDMYLMAIFFSSAGERHAADLGQGGCRGRSLLATASRWRVDAGWRRLVVVARLRAGGEPTWWRWREAEVGSTRSGQLVTVSRTEVRRSDERAAGGVTNPRAATARKRKKLQLPYSGSLRNPRARRGHRRRRGRARNRRPWLEAWRHITHCKLNYYYC